MSVLSVLKIDTWTSDRVASWLSGLDSSVSGYAENFTQADVKGSQLMMLTNDDLERIGVKKLGHQEILLQSITLLRRLSYELDNETLLSAVLQLSCHARNLTNELTTLVSLSMSARLQSAEYSVQRRHYVSVLSGVSHTVNSIKTVARMIDRIPFEPPECDTYDEDKCTLIVYGLKLLNLSQGPSVVSESNSQEAIMSVCRDICKLCDFLITTAMDPLVIQHSPLEQVTLHRIADEDLGIDLKVSFDGIHTVGRIAPGSNASACKKIEEGDEIVYVGGHTVVGWEQRNVVAAFAESTTEVKLILKKRPHHVVYPGFEKRKPKPRKELPKLNLGQKLRRSYGRKSRMGAVNSSSLHDISQSSVDSVPGLYENVSDNEVFNSSIQSPSFQTVRSQMRLRRATVGCEQSVGLQPSFSTGDIPSLVDKETRKSRPKSFFPSSGNELLDWKLLRKSDSSDSSEQAPETETDLSECAQNETMKPEPLIVNVAHSADLLGALPGIMSPSQLQAATTPRRSSETQAAYEIGDWTERATAASAQLLAFTRVDSQRRAEMLEQERKLSSTQQTVDKQTPSVHSAAKTRTKSNKDLQPATQAPNVQRKKNLFHRVADVNRRISCKDLGGGDCQGWLWKKKEGTGLMAGRWVKYWFVLHNRNLFYYKDSEDTKAQGVIQLIAFTVSPTRSKSKKYAFKAFRSDVVFYFAAERQDDMAKWMNKLGLATLVEYDSTEHQQPAAHYRETSAAAAAYCSESDDEIFSPSSQLSTIHSLSGSSEALSPQTGLPVYPAADNDYSFSSDSDVEDR